MITEEDYKGLKTEIGANKCLSPKTYADRAWNDGLDKALVS